MTTVFIGVEDGVSIYDKPENISGIDRAMQQDHMRRVSQAAAQRAMWEYRQQMKEKSE